MAHADVKRRFFMLSDLVRKLSFNRRVWVRCMTSLGEFIIPEILQSVLVNNIS